MSDQRIIFSPERNQWTLTDGRHHMEVPEWAREWREVAERVQAENAKLRELVRGLHMAHVGMVERYRSSEEGLIWEYSGSIDEDRMKLRQECDEERHRFDVAMRELGVEVTA